MSTLFDPRLQPERTTLAWRRTGIAAVLGSLVAARIFLEVFDEWVAAIALSGVLAAVAFLFAIGRRYRRHHKQLMTHGDRAPIANGILPATTALFVLGAAITGFVLAVSLAARR